MALRPINWREEETPLPYSLQHQARLGNGKGGEHSNQTVRNVKKFFSFESFT